ncbi:hypothetical protein MMC21_000015 [Puttea exsequens]|nr:hypothetical protein [Puttea exsequens]
MGLVVGREVDDEIVASSTSGTVYPSILQDLSMPAHQSITFKSEDGQVIYEGWYYRPVHAAGEPRHEARKPLIPDVVRPSNIGRYEGSKNLMFIYEKIDSLMVRYPLTMDSFHKSVDLRRIKLGYIGMRWTDSCPHSVDDYMDMVKYKPMSTSVAAPSAFGRLAVAMTRGSVISQFFACEDGHQAVLQRRCCLNCVVEPYVGKKHVVIIAT